MKLSELARNASRTQNRKEARKVAESLRFRMGMNYAQSMDWAKRRADLGPDEFEELMALADEG